MKKTILVVDDNVINLAVVESTLEKNYIIIPLTSAEKMFRVLEKLLPDLILLDIDMPEMNGLEAMKILQETERYKDVPVIFLTGLTDKDTEAYGLELGAVDLIAKPFSEPVLINRIKTHIHIEDMIKEKDELFHKETERTAHLQGIIDYALSEIDKVLEKSDVKKESLAKIKDILVS